MLDAYHEPDCAVEAAIVKVLNFNQTRVVMDFLFGLSFSFFTLGFQF